MFPLNSVVRAAPAVSRNMLQTRNVLRTTNIVSSGPRVHISFAEKLAHGFVIAAAIMTIPTWVLVHIKDYKSG